MHPLTRVAFNHDRLRQILTILASILAFVVALAGPGTASADEGGRRTQGFGLGLGSGTIANGLSMKYFMGGTALQGVVGVWGGGGIGERFHHANGLAVSADYLIEMPALASSEYFAL